MSIQPQREQGNKSFFSLEGVMGDKLENACRNHKPVRLILSRGANVSGYIIKFDRQFAQAVIETENGECVIRLGYLIQIFVKNDGEPNETEMQTQQPKESFMEYAKKHPHLTSTCKNCGKPIPDKTTFCSKDCVEQYKTEKGDR